MFHMLLLHCPKQRILWFLTWSLSCLFIFLFFPFIFISWRLITLQYCSGFCHTLTWTSHGFTCIPHPDPPSHLPPHPIPLGLPSLSSFECSMQWVIFNFKILMKYLWIFFHILQKNKDIIIYPNAYLFPSGHLVSRVYLNKHLSRL